MKVSHRKLFAKISLMIFKMHKKLKKFKYKRIKTKSMEAIKKT